MGEIWQEIITELDMERVKLIAPDSEATDTILRATEERALGNHMKLVFFAYFVFLFCSGGSDTNLYIRTI